MQGVVCDFDARDGVGIIDADDGERRSLRFSALR
jgi:hypothetical protein